MEDNPMKWDEIPFIEETDVGAIPPGARVEPHAPPREEPGALAVAGKVSTAAGEIAMTFATGAVAEPVAGVAALGGIIYDAMRGKDFDLDAAVERVNEWADLGTYTPKSEYGVAAAESMYDFIEPWSEGYGDVIKVYMGMGGPLGMRASPEGATLLHTAGVMVPGTLFAGFKKGMSGPQLKKDGLPKPESIIERDAEVRQVKKTAAAMGIELTESRTNQTTQIGQAAWNLGQVIKAKGVAVKGAALAHFDLQIKHAKKAAKEVRDNMYKRAREGGEAYSLRSDIDEIFAPAVTEFLKAYDIDMMPTVQRRLKEAQRMLDRPFGDRIPISEMETWRKRLGANIPKDGSPESAALFGMKGLYDDFMAESFHNDLLKGDPAAITRWKDARAFHRRYKEDFSDQKFMRDLATREMGPEEVRKLLFGMSNAGFRPEAARMISHLNRVLGEDNPAMKSLRMDATLNILEPLLDADPNLKTFYRRYEDLITNNRSVARELFLEEDLSDLHAISRAVERHGSADTVYMRFAQLISRMTLGSGLAKAAAKVGLGTLILDKIFDGPIQSRKRIISEIVGYDITTPMVPKAPWLVTSLGQSAQTLEEDD
jgi:hypothetical protein